MMFTLGFVLGFIVGWIVFNRPQWADDAWAGIKAKLPWS